MDDLIRLRRFALLTGLILAFYSLAGITIESSNTIHPFGVPFRIIRPDLVHFALVIASVYAALRYYFFAFMVQRTPYRKRQQLREDAKAAEGLSFSYEARSGDNARSISNELHELYPKFLMARPRGEILIPPNEGNTLCQVHIVIPRRCRAGAWFSDLDYSLPILVNLVAWVLYFSCA